MNANRERYILDVISGRRRGAGASLLRLALAAAEPGYAGLVRARNLLYDHGIFRTRSLPRPTVSVGNITTGGTGKTPVVCWLADALRAAGRSPAVLLRGYARAGGSDEQAGGSDEQAVLRRELGDATPVIADPDRLRGAAKALTAMPGVDVFLLDDGMQHRRARRNADIVLVSAAAPFGFGHVLPRGLLREPLAGLRRATAFVITHAGEVSPDDLRRTEATLSRHNPAAPVFRADHVHTGLRTPEGGADLPLSTLADISYFVACGVGQPESFLAAVRARGPRFVGHRFFPDHHAFTPDDVAALRRDAAAAGAEAVIVTEKDWVKIGPLLPPRDVGIPYWRVRLQICFRDDGGDRLLRIINERIGP